MQKGAVAEDGAGMADEVDTLPVAAFAATVVAAAAATNAAGSSRGAVSPPAAATSAGARCGTGVRKGAVAENGAGMVATIDT